MNESIYARDMNTYHNCVPEKIIHEKQSLQLCALHAVNNLLQISQDAEELSAQVEGSQDETFSIVFCAGNYYKCDRKFRKHAFKKEFDEIADKLQQQEKDILLQGSTWLTSFIRTSNHRSFLTGNYSFEVIEVALQRRGVSLERCYQSDLNSIFNKFQEGNVIVGFIIHSLTPTTTEVSLRSVLGQIFTSGHHWYAISRLRRMKSAHEEQSETWKSRKAIHLDGKNNAGVWHIIDSCVDHVTDIQTNKELLYFLEQVRDEGADIFRAEAKLDLVS